MMAADAERPRATIGEAWIVLVGVIAVAAANLMFWHVDYPPLIDLPNHLARHSVQCTGESREGLARYFEYDFTLVPNLSAELVYLLPAACRSLVTTQKILLQFAMTGLLVATILLHASVWRRWSVWPLLGAFGLTHMAFAYGFENFYLAMPPALLALALWSWLRERSPAQRLVPMIPAVAAVYVLHLYACLFVLGMLGLLELQKW